MSNVHHVMNTTTKRVERCIMKEIKIQIDVILMRYKTLSGMSHYEIYKKEDKVIFEYKWDTTHVTIKYNITCDFRSNDKIFNLYILDVQSRAKRLGIGGMIIDTLKSYIDSIFNVIYVHTVCNSDMFNMLHNRGFDIYNKLSSFTMGHVTKMLDMDLEVFDMVYVNKN